MPANVLIGSQFSGYVWIGYCTVINCNSPTNFTKVGAISVKETGGTFAGGGTIMLAYGIGGYTAVTYAKNGGIGGNNGLGGVGGTGGAGQVATLNYGATPPITP
jgi:hypothetical protein